jgi:hypothetical protein
MDSWLNRGVVRRITVMVATVSTSAAIAATADLILTRTANYE